MAFLLFEGNHGGFMAIPNYVDEKEVSRITGRAVQTLRNDRFHGRGLPYHKFGRQVRYSLEEVLDYLKNRRIEPANPL
jgi:hypothetical protein